MQRTLQAVRSPDVDVEALVRRMHEDVIAKVAASNPASDEKLIVLRVKRIRAQAIVSILNINELFPAARNSDVDLELVNLFEIENNPEITLKTFQAIVKKFAIAIRSTPSPLLQHIEQVEAKLKLFNEKHAKFSQLIAEGMAKCENAKTKMGVSTILFMESRVKKTLAESTFSELEKLKDELAKDPLHPFAEQFTAVAAFISNNLCSNDATLAKDWDACAKNYEKCKSVIEQDAQRKKQIREEVAKFDVTLAAAKESLKAFQAASNALAPAAKAAATAPIVAPAVDKRVTVK